MSHAIMERDAFGEVRARGERAWHGLGVEIPDGLSAEEGFERIGLGWRTRLLPLQAVPETGTPVPVQGHFAHVRADTGDILGLVSDGYRPFENQDLARFADALAGADSAVVMETGGSLYNGRRVFALVRLPRSFEAVPGDRVDQYLAVTNGHGGFAAFACYPTKVRIVCANTMRASEVDVARGVRFQHTGKIEDKVAQARVAIGIATEETERFEAQVRKLVATHLSERQTRDYLEQTWESCFGKIDFEATDGPTLEKLLARRKELVDRWTKNLEDERNRIPGMEGTAWAAYNAFSQWCDHERGRFLSVRESDARVHSNLFGVSNRDKTVGFRGALQLA